MSPSSPFARGHWTIWPLGEGDPVEAVVPPQSGSSSQQEQKCVSGARAGGNASHLYPSYDCQYDLIRLELNEEKSNTSSKESFEKK